MPREAAQLGFLQLLLLNWAIEPDRERDVVRAEITAALNSSLEQKHHRKSQKKRLKNSEQGDELQLDGPLRSIFAFRFD